MNKQGQLDFPIVTLIIVIVVLLLLTPIMMKIFLSIKAPVSAQLANVSGGTQAAAAFNSVMNVGITFWDKIIMAAFIISVLLLFVSAFMIDTSVVWVILYIFLCFMLILFVPTLETVLDHIYDNANFATEVTYLTFSNFLRLHLGETLVGIFVVTGIIIYGKISLFSSSSTRR